MSPVSPDLTLCPGSRPLRGHFGNRVLPHAWLHKGHWLAHGLHLQAERLLAGPLRGSQCGPVNPGIGGPVGCPQLSLGSHKVLPPGRRAVLRVACHLEVSYRLSSVPPVLIKQ